MSHALRLRRALSLSTAILSPTRRTTVSVALTAAATTLNHTPAAVNSAVRHFHSTQHLSLSSYAPRSFNDFDKIDADTILFEGCDYNHFLIVMDFGKEPNQRPPPDQMIETYVQTCAKVLGSVEEAKRKIYACSTTTYTGFQVEVDEETSKKFEGLPGVTFVLPDSYIDPANKEYGGDKYNYGEIIPRAPPVQYSRRTNDRRDDQRPRDSMRNQQGNSPYNQSGNRAYNQQGNASYNQLGSMPQGGTGYPPQGPQQGSPQRQSFPSQQNYPPQQNYLPSGQADRGTPMPGGAQYPGVGTDGLQGGQRNFVPSQEGNYNHPQGQMSNQPGNPGGYAPPGQYRSVPVNYAHNHPEGQRGNHPGGIGGYVPPAPVPGAYGQTAPVTGAYGQTSPVTGPYGQTAPATGPYGQTAPVTGTYGQTAPVPGAYAQTAPVAGAYGQTAPVAGAYGQPGVGTFEQNRGVQYSQPPSGNNYGHGAGHIPHAENQSFPPGLNEQGRPLEHGVNPYGAQPGFNQGRY